MTTLKTLALGLNRFLSRLFSDDPETIDYLNGADSLPPPLNKEEEKKAFELLETDPKKARELLIVHNLRLVVYIAKKFESTGTGIEDLISIGSIGLIKAVNTFCPDKNIKLATERASITSALEDFAKEKRAKLGLDIIRSHIAQACRLSSVYDVTVVAPAANLIISDEQFPNCTGITVNVTGFSRG